MLENKFIIRIFEEVGGDSAISVEDGDAIFINALVISEFCNQWLRIEFKTWSKKFSDTKEYKKDFIHTPEFKNAVLDVKDALIKIFRITERGSDNFNAIDLQNLLQEFGISDFNDSYYIELAHLNKWKIVTDDADFFRFASYFNNRLSWNSFYTGNSLRCEIMGSS